MGDRTGDSFRGWVYALGLCWGGVRWEFVSACAFRRVPWRCGVLDCWDVGRRSGVCRGCVLGLERSILGLHITYMMNVTS